MSIPKLPLAFLLLFLPVLSLAAEPKVYYWSIKEDCFHQVDFSKSPDERLPEDEFNEREKTIVLIHGFAENIHREMYRDFARRIKQFEPKTNVLGIDWSDNQNVSWIPGEDPVTATSFIPDVAQKAYELLFSYQDGLNLCAPKMHIIGFSHGAHIAALIGKRTGGIIGHLTFLDPSPARSQLFSWENFLGSGWTVEQSSRFSDMYKSSTWTSTSQARGHVTFFVCENGIMPPDALNNDDIYKNHYYAVHWYISTIGKNNDQLGYSIKIPDTANRSTDQFRTINSSLPRKKSAEYTPQDYINVKSFLIP